MKDVKTLILDSLTPRNLTVQPCTTVPQIILIPKSFKQTLLTVMACGTWHQGVTNHITWVLWHGVVYKKVFCCLPVGSVVPMKGYLVYNYVEVTGTVTVTFTRIAGPEVSLQNI